MAKLHIRRSPAEYPFACISVPLCIFIKRKLVYPFCYLVNVKGDVLKLGIPVNIDNIVMPRQYNGVFALFAALEQCSYYAAAKRVSRYRLLVHVFFMLLKIIKLV